MRSEESNYPSFKGVVALLWNNYLAFLVCLKVDNDKSRLYVSDCSQFEMQKMKETGKNIYERVILPARKRQSPAKNIALLASPIVAATRPMSNPIIIPIRPAGWRIICLSVCIAACPLQ